MAIAFDSVAQEISGSTSSTITWNHTVSGSNTILFVEFSAVDQSALRNATSVTFNGVALTGPLDILQNTLAGNFIDSEVWYLVNPPTGTHQVAVNLSAGANFGTYCTSLSYTGVHQTAPIDSHNAQTDNGVPATTGTTTVVGANCWVVGIIDPAFDAPNVSSAGTTRATNFAADSNSVFGTGPQGFTWLASGSGAWPAVFTFSLLPSAAQPPVSQGAMGILIVV
jgi:hypothetical protein